MIERYALRVPAPAVTSTIGPGIRQTVTRDGRTSERYPIGYRPDDSLAGHLWFALRYEPIDLGVLSALFKTTAAADDIRARVMAEPNGAYSRRAWFFYEWLTGTRLDLPDAGTVRYVDALDTSFHITARGIRSQRHKVTDNIPGCPGFAPLVRRTPRLEAFKAEAIEAEARAIVAGCDPAILARAVMYLYTKETKSTFAIERETATGKRAERFVAALRSAGSFSATDTGSLIALQNAIVDPRYAAASFRNFQNFVGEIAGDYREIVHFICPRPADVGPLMADWARMTQRLKGSADPVVNAALVAFAFVFIQPFEDGNGRIHRFLIHHVLSAEGFTPLGMLFPVSAAIIRDRKGYDSVLETVSAEILRGSSPFVVGRNVLTRAAASRACLPADTPSP